MSKRCHSQPVSRRRILARPQAINSAYRRPLLYEPLEDRRLLAVVAANFNDGRPSLTAIANKIDTSTIVSNSAALGGSAIFRLSAPLSLTASTASRNSAGRDGGGIAAVGLVTLSNTTIGRNTATINGSGLWASNGPAVKFSTVYEKHASQADGGVYVTAGISTIENSIIAPDIAPSGADISSLLRNTDASAAAAALAIAPNTKEPASLNLIPSAAPVDPVVDQGTAGIELPVAVLPPSICPTPDVAPVEPVVDSNTAMAVLPVVVLPPGVCPTPDVALVEPVVDSSTEGAVLPPAVLPPGVCPTPDVVVTDPVFDSNTAGGVLPVAVLPPGVCPTPEVVAANPVVDSNTGGAVLPVAVLPPGICPTPDVTPIDNVVGPGIGWAALPAAVLPRGLCPTPAGPSMSAVDEALTSRAAKAPKPDIVDCLTDSTREANAVDQAFATLGA